MPSGGLISDRQPPPCSNRGTLPQLQSPSTQQKEARVDRSWSLEPPQPLPSSALQISFQSSGETSTLAWCDVQVGGCAGDSTRGEGSQDQGLGPEGPPAGVDPPVLHSNRNLLLLSWWGKGRFLFFQGPNLLPGALNWETTPFPAPGTASPVCSGPKNTPPAPTVIYTH